MTRMAQPVALHQDALEIVLGVDTHKDAHVAAVVTAAGAFVDSRSFPATADGYRSLLDWARTSGRLDRAGVECTGSYGAALSRHLRAQGVTVVEVNQPDKATRRRRGKNDTIDAEAAARAVITGRATADAKAGDGQLRSLHHRAGPPPMGRPHPRLHRPAHLRRQDPTRSTPLPQTLRRTRDPPTHHPLQRRPPPPDSLKIHRGIKTATIYLAGLHIAAIFMWSAR
ncbi:IS110 family transposase [Streptomyces sp. NRRL B-24484]|uniref:IS110 family transposase n=1 Tax=Streptomyces sp. NRRL B-24484 TaxID=1463833 RepID=UPI000B2B027F|nr:transposase [Streptomyces sp. NRRL B-24484]